MAFLKQSGLPEVFFTAFQGFFVWDAVITSLIDDNLLDCFEWVEVKLLWNQADLLLCLHKILIKVVSKYLHSPSCFIDQGGNDSDGSGFSSAIWSKECVEIALFHN
ncbi:hypothetical protein SDC9_190688 [bioreactor metagenome]|uniref:Uncharacterized protein n=1 Tax=bioreactor metagenome TaxID=1076179 RepID=A0A645HY69_9ZZZZ